MSEAKAKRDQLAANFQRVMDDIDTLLGAKGTKPESEVAALRERLLERLNDTRRRIGDLQYEGIEHARRAARQADDYAHEHPWQAASIGAALGLLVGVLIARR
jgi:ElaB/YqjD/DUF883 family membrane-anchored ribosome-binding protein